MAKRKRKVKSGAFLVFFLVVLAGTIGVLSVMKFLNGVSNSKKHEYSKDLDYFDTKINVKLYVNNDKDGDEIFAEVDKILSHYSQISSRTKAVENVVNIYSINNTNGLQKLTIDPDLYNILKYSVNWFYENGQVLNINMGKLALLWNPYWEAKNGTPSVEEVNKVVDIDMKDVVLYADNQILAGKVNLDVDSISLAFALDEVKNYFKQVNFDNYIINASNVYLVGKNITTDYYPLNIKNPEANENLKENGSEIKLNLTNKFMSTVGMYDSYKNAEYNIHRVLDYRTRVPASYMKSVTVISDDPVLGQSLASTLFLITPEEGLEYIKKFSEVEAIWYSNDGKIITTSNIKKYR